MGDEQDIQLPIQHKTQRNAHHKTGHRIGASFGRDHAFQLCIIHPDGTQDAILLHSCRHAHGNAVDDVQNGDSCNHDEKRIDHQMERPVGALYHPISFDSVGKNNLLV